MNIIEGESGITDLQLMKTDTLFMAGKNYHRDIVYLPMGIVCAVL